MCRNVLPSGMAFVLLASAVAFALSQQSGNAQGSAQAQIQPAIQATPGSRNENQQNRALQLDQNQPATQAQTPPGAQSQPFFQSDSLLIGPGDLVHVQVFETPELDETARVSDSGDLPLILGGTVHLASLNPTEAARVVERALVQAKIMYQPRVLVTVAQYATQTVSVFGQVKTAGSYPISTPRSVLDVLALAGGLTDLSDRHIFIERHTTHEMVPYYVANRVSDVSSGAGLLIYPGDRITVPLAGIVYVLGDVTKAGGFPMTDNQSSLTALEAVSLAGGTLPSAVPSHAVLVRRAGDGGYTRLPLQLSQMQKGKRADFPLQAGDILYIPFSYLRNAVVNLNSVLSAAASGVIYNIR